MAAMIERARKRLSKRAKKGFWGWPLATVALYGPDDSTATKLTVGIVPAEDAEATDLRRWFSKALSRRCAVEREGLAPQGTVRPLRPPPPRVHSRSAKHVMRLGRGEMALGVK